MIFWPRVAWGLGLCAGKVRANDPSRTPPLQRAGGQEMLPWLAGGAAAGAAAGAAIGAAVGAAIGENVEEPARRERRWSVDGGGCVYA